VIGRRPDLDRVIPTTWVGEEPIDDGYAPADMALRTIWMLGNGLTTASATHPAGMVNENVAAAEAPLGMKHRPGSISPPGGRRGAPGTAIGVARCVAVAARMGLGAGPTLGAAERSARRAVLAMSNGAPPAASRMT
jgi:hypothetical protein